jgi:hypothetical protein
VTRREYFNNRVVNSYPCGIYDIHGSFGTQFYCPRERLFCLATRSGPCSGPSNLGIIFVLSISHVEQSCSAFVASFSSPLDALAVSSPFGSVSGTDTLLTTHVYIFCRSFFIFLNHLLYSRSRVSGVNFYFCIFPQFNPCGEVCCSSWGNCDLFTLTSVTLNTLNSSF